MTVADHQPATSFIHLASVGGDVGGDLGLQRRGQHPPGTVPDDLIEQRAPSSRAGVVGLPVFVDYREYRRTFPNQRSNAGPDPSYLDFRSSSGRSALSRHPAEGHSQV